MKSIIQTEKIRKIIILYLICMLVPVSLYGEEGKVHVEKPIAAFTFTKESYQQSEPITVEEKSYSKSGNKIVKKEWMTLINGKKKTASNISSLLKGVDPGKREVFLRVKDSKGTWSDWTSQKLEIKPLEPFTITSFKTEEDTYDIGEKINFIYDFSNTNELSIQSQKWRYKNITTGSNVVSSKPKYFSKAGTYEVTLELQDEWGNWSNKGICTVKVSNEQIERNGLYLFNKGKQGDLLEDYIDKDYNTFDALEDVKVEDIPGTLIVSNSPETINSSGILYKDTSVGKGRLVVHHLNEGTIPKKLMVVATTSSNEPIELKVKDEVIKGPHKNILKTGQTAVREYFEGRAEKVYAIMPGTPTCIYDSSNIKPWNKGEVISGTLDFESSGPITWMVVSMDLQSKMENISKLAPLERGMHIRGTFDVIERHYSINIQDLKNPGKIVIGGNEDEWLVGKDALTGAIVNNKGNYGLPIEIELKSKEDMGVILNARGGSYLGSIKWNNQKVFDVPSENVLSSKKLAALIGKVKGQDTAKWTYMLPNGSSAPVLFGFVPSHLWSK
nr:hypothetical protein [uncultured Niameybacter sp.]